MTQRSANPWEADAVAETPSRPVDLGLSSPRGRPVVPIGGGNAWQNDVPAEQAGAVGPQNARRRIDDTFATVRPNEMAPVGQRLSGRDAAQEFVGARIARNQYPVLARVDAAVRGVADAMTLGTSDEIAAALGATFQPVFGTGREGQSWGERYDRNLNRERAQAAADEADRFLERLGGQIVGGVAVPIGVGAQTAPQFARAGAVAGGLYGIGSGGEAAQTVPNSIADRAIGGVVGAGLGAAIGTATPYVLRGAGVVADGIGGMVNRAVQPYRGMRNVDAEAERRVGQAIMADVGPDAAMRMDQMQRFGQPARVMDLGGEGATLPALARAAANTSDNARRTLQNVTEPRFETQQSRLADFIFRMSGATGDAANTSARLRDLARETNRPAYERAYRAPEAQAMWDETLQRLASAPAFREAMREAADRSGNRAAIEGNRQIVNPFTFDQAGNVSLRRNADGSTATPNLAYWDVVQRTLRDAYDSARRSGSNERAADIAALRQQLNQHLDAAVPAFGQARRNAAQFFGAEDALDAGRNFVMQRFDMPEARREMARMSGPERALFREGFASELIQRVQAVPDRRDILNQIFLPTSSAARERIEIALGPRQARELEAYLRVEGMMQSLHRAVSGNSSTVQQWIATGLIGGGAGFMAGFDPTTSAGLAVAARAGAQQLRQNIDRRVADRVAQLLVSDNPGDFQRAMQMAAQNRSIMQAIRQAEEYIARTAGIQGSNASEGVQRGVTGAVNPMTGRAEDRPPAMPPQ